MSLKQIKLNYILLLVTVNWTHRYKEINENNWIQINAHVTNISKKLFSCYKNKYQTHIEY